MTAEVVGPMGATSAAIMQAAAGTAHQASTMGGKPMGHDRSSDQSGSSAAHNVCCTSTRAMTVVRGGNNSPVGGVPMYAGTPHAARTPTATPTHAPVLANTRSSAYTDYSSPLYNPYVQFALGGDDDLEDDSSNNNCAVHNSTSAAATNFSRLPPELTFTVIHSDGEEGEEEGSDQEDEGYGSCVRIKDGELLEIASPAAHYDCADQQASTLAPVGEGGSCNALPRARTRPHGVRRSVSFADEVAGKSLHTTQLFREHDPPSLIGNARRRLLRKAAMVSANAGRGRFCVGCARARASSKCTHRFSTCASPLTLPVRALARIYAQSLFAYVRRCASYAAVLKRTP